MIANVEGLEEHTAIICCEIVQMKHSSAGRAVRTNDIEQKF